MANHLVGHLANSFFGPSPFNEFDRLRRDIDVLFNPGLARGGIRQTVTSAPLLSIGETQDDVRVFVFAPGLDAASIDVTLQGNLLRIGGRRAEEPELKDAPKFTVHRHERRVDSFDRLVTLPETVDPDNVHAEYSNGVLQLTIGKRPEVKPRKIEVSTGRATSTTGTATETALQ